MPFILVFSQVGVLSCQAIFSRTEEHCPFLMQTHPQGEEGSPKDVKWILDLPFPGFPPTSLTVEVPRDRHPPQQWGTCWIHILGPQETPAESENPGRGLEIGVSEVSPETSK